MSTASRLRGLSVAAEQKSHSEATITVFTKAPKADGGKGARRASLPYVRETIDGLLKDASKLVGTVKLTVEGRWIYGHEVSNDVEPVENGVGLGKREKALEVIALQECEWVQAIQLFKNLMAVMHKLTTFKWTTELPFSGQCFEVLPTTIRDMHLNVLIPEVPDAIRSPSCTSGHDLAPLIHFKDLRVLKIEGMQDSLQLVAWATAFNSPLHTLSLSMANLPILREDEADWPMITKDMLPEITSRVVALDQWNTHAASIEGTGKLGWLHGYGEYLDHKAIIGGRYAVACKTTHRQLPIRELTLKGFVVDDTGFRYHFGNLVALRLEQCFDAGLAFVEGVKEGLRVDAPEAKECGVYGQ